MVLATAVHRSTGKQLRNPALHIVPSVIGNVRASPTDRQTKPDTQATGQTRQTFLSRQTVRHADRHRDSEILGRQRDEILKYLETMRSERDSKTTH